MLCWATRIHVEKLTRVSLWQASQVAVTLSPVVPREPTLHPAVLRAATLHLAVLREPTLHPAVRLPDRLPPLFFRSLTSFLCDKARTVAAPLARMAVPLARMAAPLARLDKLCVSFS